MTATREEWSKKFEMMPFAFAGLDPRRFVEMQKIALDLYARQTEAALDSMRLLFPFIPSSVFDSSQNCIFDLFRIQMKALDEIVSRSRSDAGASEGEPLKNILQYSADWMTDCQKQFVDSFARQLQGFWQTMGIRPYEKETVKQLPA